jgi:hypothetical protein
MDGFTQTQLPLEMSLCRLAIAEAGCPASTRRTEAAGVIA